MKITDRLATAVSIALLATIGAGMLFLSWLKWPDILVDFGWELYAPWQLNNGAVLYKDIISLFGPLSFCVNALVFRLFGTSLLSIVYFNIAIIALLTFIMYRFFIVTTDRVTATTVSALFLSLFAFSQYVGTGNYNFVCPYSHQMTHSIFLSFLAIYLFALYLKKQRDGLLCMIGLLMGLVFLAKSEVFIALAAAISAGMILIAIMDKLQLKRIAIMFLALFTGFILPVIAFTLFIAHSTSLDTALSAITAAYRNIFGTGITSNIFYRKIMGTDVLAANAAKLLITALSYVGTFLFFGLVGYAIDRITDKRFKAAFIVCLLALAYIVATFLINGPQLFDIFRGLPLAMLALGLYLLTSFIKRRDHDEVAARELSLLVMVIFGFFLLAKMFLNAHIFHYGFALAMPATLLLGTVFVYYAPTVFGKSTDSKFIIRCLGIFLVSVVIIFYVTGSKRFYNLKTFPVGGGADTIITFDPRVSIKGPCVRVALREIKKLIGKDENFLVLPEGIMLNYLSRRKNPFPYVHFMPFELATVSEEKILESLIKARPDYIILMDRDTSEYGYHYFGKDYGVKVYEWIKNNYSPISSIGNQPFSGSGFGITITKRKE